MFGAVGVKPVVGDWDGDGKTTIGVLRSGVFYLKNTNQTGFADLAFTLSDTSGQTVNSNSQPMAGDWDGRHKHDMVFIGKHYEKELVSGIVTKRYYAGSRLLATRAMLTAPTRETLNYIQPDSPGVDHAGHNEHQHHQRPRAL